MKPFVLISLFLVLCALPWACGSNSNPTYPNQSTSTFTPVPTSTLSNTPTGSITPTPSNSPTLTPTKTPSSTPTHTPTPTLSFTATDSPSTTPSSTPTQTPTESPTPTVTNTFTITPTETPTLTPTNSPTQSPTRTPTLTPTNSPTATFTNTPLPVGVIFSVYSPSIGVYRYSTSGTGGPAVSAPITISATTSVVWDGSNGGIHPLYLDNSSSCVINNQGTGFPTTVILGVGTYRFHCGIHGGCATPDTTCVNGSCTGLAATLVVQ